MPRVRSAFRLLVAAAALGLAGCGASTSSSNFEGEEKAVANVVDDLSTAAQRKDAERICDEILAPALAKQVSATGSTCVAEIDRTIDDADDFDLEVTDVTVAGNTAKATVKGRGRGDADQTAVMELAKQGEDWRITSLTSQ
jgi:hypothetical protein